MKRSALCLAVTLSLSSVHCGFYDPGYYDNGYPPGSAYPNGQYPNGYPPGAYPPGAYPPGNGPYAGYPNGPNNGQVVVIDPDADRRAREQQAERDRMYRRDQRGREVDPWAGRPGEPMHPRAQPNYEPNPGYGQVGRMGGAPAQASSGGDVGRMGGGPVQRDPASYGGGPSTPPASVPTRTGSMGAAPSGSGGQKPPSMSEGPVKGPGGDSYVPARAPAMRGNMGSEAGHVGAPARR